MKRPTFDEIVRAAVFMVALGITGYLAVVQHSEAAAGGILGLLGVATSYQFRGKQEQPKP